MKLIQFILAILVTICAIGMLYGAITTYSPNENILYYNNEYHFYWMRFVCDTCIQGIKNKLNV